MNNTLDNDEDDFNPFSVTDDPSTNIQLPCPVHGEELETKVEDGKVYGTCQCKVPRNTFKGKVVYEGVA